MCVCVLLLRRQREAMERQKAEDRRLKEVQKAATLERFMASPSGRWGDDKQPALPG